MKTPTPICLLTIALLAAMLVAPAISRAQNLYISNSYIDSVGEYNATTGAPIPGFAPPSGTAALVLAGNNLYVSTQSGNAPNANTIGEYNATTGAPIPGFTSPSGLNNPFGMAISGNDLYVSTSDIIGEYNATTGAPIPGYTPPSGLLNQPFDLLISGNDLYVSTGSSGTVEEYNLMTGAPIPGFTLSGLGDAAGLALSGNILYVSTYDYGTVGAYNATTGAPIPGFSLSPTGLSYPAGLAVSGNILYVVNNGAFTGSPPYNDRTVGAYNATTGAVINPSLISGLSQPAFIAVSVPEPSTWSMIAVGGVALLGIMLRKTHHNA